MILKRLLQKEKLVDKWLENHKEILFVFSAILVMAFDAFLATTDFEFYNQQYHLGYHYFFMLSVSYNWFAFYLIPYYFMKLNIRNIILYSLLAVVVYHLIFIAFVAIGLQTPDIQIVNDSIGIPLLFFTIFRPFCYFTIYIIFLLKKTDKFKFQIYRVLVIAYLPFYFCLVLVYLGRVIP